MRTAIAWCCFLWVGFLYSSSSRGDLLIPNSISSQGSFNNSDSLLIDGIFPGEGTGWTQATNAFWNGQLGAGGVTFTIDYGDIFNVEDILVSVDNNDGYRIEHSLDNIAFSTLAQISIGDGEIGFGMDTMSSDSTSPEYVSSVDFSPVNARYLRIYATGGDNSYSIGEVQAFGTAVPEPTSFTGILLAGLWIGNRRRRRN